LNEANFGATVLTVPVAENLEHAGQEVYRILSASCRTMLYTTMDGVICHGISTERNATCRFEPASSLTKPEPFGSFPAVFLVPNTVSTPL